MTLAAMLIFGIPALFLLAMCVGEWLAYRSGPDDQDTPSEHDPRRLP